MFLLNLNLLLYKTEKRNIFQSHNGRTVRYKMRHEKGSSYD